MRRWIVITVDVRGNVVDRHGPLFFRRNANRDAARSNARAENSSLHTIGKQYGVKQLPWHAHVERVTAVTPPLARRGHRIGLPP